MVLPDAAMPRPASAWPKAARFHCNRAIATQRSGAMTNDDEILAVSYWQRQAILTISQRMASQQLGEAFLNTEYANAATAQHAGDAAATVPNVGGAASEEFS